MHEIAVLRERGIVHGGNGAGKECGNGREESGYRNAMDEFLYNIQHG